jgi:hypothetical protein
MSDFDRFRPLELYAAWACGTSPYLDWFLETFYIHRKGWVQ